MYSHGRTIGVADGTNTDLLRPSDWNSAHVKYYTLTGNTVGSSTLSGSSIYLSGGAGITLVATSLALNSTTERYLVIENVNNTGGGKGNFVQANFDFSTIANNFATTENALSIMEYSIENNQPLRDYYIPVSVSAATAANNSTAALNISGTICAYTRTGDTLNSILSAGALFVNNLYSSNATGSVNGLRWLQFNIGAGAIVDVAKLFSNVGVFYLGFLIKTSNTVSNSLSLSSTALVASLTVMGNNRVDLNNNVCLPFGSTSNSSTAVWHYGVYTAATTGIPATINLKVDINYRHGSVGQCHMGVRLGSFAAGFV